MVGSTCMTPMNLPLTFWHQLSVFASATLCHGLPCRCDLFFPRHVVDCFFDSHTSCYHSPVTHGIVVSFLLLYCHRGECILTDSPVVVTGLAVTVLCFPFLFPFRLACVRLTCVRQTDLLTAIYLFISTEIP